MSARLRVLPDGRVDLIVNLSNFPIRGRRDLAALIDHFRLIELWGDGNPDLAHRNAIHLRNLTITTRPDELALWNGRRYHRDTFTPADAGRAADEAAAFLLDGPILSSPQPFTNGLPNDPLSPADSRLPEWHQAITASKVPAILGLSPWASPYSTWLSMTTGADPIKVTAAMKRGNLLEAGLLNWFESDHPDLVPAGRQLAYTLTDDDPTIFATTDGTYRTLDGDLVAVEVKTVSRDDDWRDPSGAWIVPDYYLAQVYFQLACTQATRAIVVALTPHLEKVEIDVPRDFGTEAAIVEEVYAWQEALADGIAPDLDDTVATYKAVRRAHPEIDDVSVEIPFAVAHRWLDAKDVKDRAEKAELRAKSELLRLMGSAKTAVSENLVVAVRTPGARDSVTLRAKASAADLEEVAWV